MSGTVGRERQRARRTRSEQSERSESREREHQISQNGAPLADQATQRATIAASPERLFEVVTDFEGYTDWARDLKAVEVV